MAVSIRCSPASTAEPVGTFRSGSQRQVSIRCSPASTAEPDSYVEHQQLGGFYSLLASEYSGTRRVTRWSCARRGFYSLLASEYSGTLQEPPSSARPARIVSIRCSPASTAERDVQRVLITFYGMFLFAARQRVQRNVMMLRKSLSRWLQFLFAARQRVQRNDRKQSRQVP